MNSDSSYKERLALEIAAEANAVQVVKEFAEKNAEALRVIWRWGGENGTGILQIIADTISEPTDLDVPNPRRSNKKKQISHELRKSVFERDAYRCVSCGGHKDLCCDHIYPESKGGETTFENLQTMCRTCNSKKGTKVFPAGEQA